MSTIPPSALFAVKTAWRCLLEAQYSLDESGLECPALADVQAETGAIAAVWQGRQPPDADPGADLPAYFIEGVKEWRRRNGRIY